MTAASTALAPPLYSGTSLTTASSPAVPSGPLYSGTSRIGAASSPAVPSGPLYSGTSRIGAASSPLLLVGASGFTV